MAPIKFEEHIKEKLARREIKPSEAGWDKLRGALDEKERNSSNSKWWISSVAAVIVLLICGVLYLNLIKYETSQIVDAPSENKKTKEIEKVQPFRIVENKPEVISKESVQEKTTLEIDKPAGGQTHKAPHYAAREVLKEAPTVVKNSEYFNEIGAEKTLLTARSARNEEMIMAEVNSLLATAALESNREQDKVSSKESSASNLLAEIEYEVDQSFRKEVFEFLKAEFVKAKTAVATRND